MPNTSSLGKPRRARPVWFADLADYASPDLSRAVWQLINTFVPYLVLWGLAIATMRQGYSFWLTLALIVLATLFQVRIFIFFHDCCHGSFFASRQANRILGYITGVLTLTPYEDWRSAHARHHATAGDLDRRGVGDIWTLTVEEYQAAPRLQQIGYRAFRNPLVLLLLGPVWIFVLGHRFAHKGAKPRERNSVRITNLALLALAIVAYLTIGLRIYLTIHLAIIVISGALGIWLFYVQHQFEGVYWARHDEWDPIRGGLQGSSYYRLPKILQWFTGNIGLHHIHHLHSRIPNYRLQDCQDNVPAMQEVRPLTIGRSLKSLWLNLWDEQNQELVSFRALKTT